MPDFLKNKKLISLNLLRYSRSPPELLKYLIGLIFKKYKKLCQVKILKKYKKKSVLLTITYPF